LDRDSLPWARFMDSLGDACRTLAKDLYERAGEEEPVPPVAVPGDIPELSGKRQTAIVELAELLNEAGVKTSDIAKAIHYEEPNTHLTLKNLEHLGHIEMVPGSKPQRWRLAAKYRSSQPYMKFAKYVRKGEWTTYGDISIAHRGDTKAARAVGRAAATLAQFPVPHRVLEKGGVIPEGWHADDGEGPKECRRRLEEDGVRFTLEGRAHPSQRINWDLLVLRVEEDEGP